MNTNQYLDEKLVEYKNTKRKSVLKGWFCLFVVMELMVWGVISLFHSVEKNAALQNEFKVFMVMSILPVMMSSFYAFSMSISSYAKWFNAKEDVNLFEALKWMNQKHKENMSEIEFNLMVEQIYERYKLNELLAQTQKTGDKDKIDKENLVKQDIISLYNKKERMVGATSVLMTYVS